MSLKSLPLVFINLGGEMMYILDQRLTAQNIALDKAEKVICDIVATMLSSEFMEELFKPQQLYSPKAMKAVFEKLAHSSIMKLNTTSMDKLYDLMTMVFKHQVVMCPTPYDLIFVTLNHLDAIRRYVINSPVLAYLVDCTHARVIKHYGCLTTGEMQLIRCSILSFFQDLRIRVSVFLKEGLQNPNGTFLIPTAGVPVPHGTEIPGSITEFSGDGKVLNKSSFDTGAEYLLPKPMGSLEPLTKRGITLGCNIYTMNQSSEDDVESALSVYDSRNMNSLTPVDGPPKVPSLDSRAHEELTLLAHLIGLSSTPKPQFTINLFSPDQDQGQNQVDNSLNNVRKTKLVNLDGTKATQNEELNKIMSDLNFEKLDLQNIVTDGQELLDLMDSAT